MGTMELRTDLAVEYTPPSSNQREERGVLPGSIARIGELLDQYGRPRECATVLSCVGMKDEYIGPLDPEREYSYFTTVMIKREKR